MLKVTIQEKDKKYKISLPDFIILIGRLLNGHHINDDDLITYLLARLFIMSKKGVSNGMVEGIL